MRALYCTSGCRVSRCLLFISPLFPAADATGSAKRANVFLDAFASDFEVHLVVVLLAGLPVTDDQFASLRRRCREIHVLPAAEPAESSAFHTAVPSLAHYTGGSIPGRVREVMRSVSADVVHVFRLYLAPLAFVGDGGSGRRPRLQLDLDDYESRTHAAIARRLRHRQQIEFAEFELAESQRYRGWENVFIPRFDRTFVTSERDRTLIAERFARGGIEVVPNAVEIPWKRSRSKRDRPFTLLFVGTLDYFPNDDGLVWFLEEVLPWLRAAACGAFRVQVVGPYPSDVVLMLAAEASEVEIAGFVMDVSESYHYADAVIAPIQAGGGTRIKILEAFAFHRPVVATTSALEGIEARNGEHLLVANDPATFAACCLRLMSDDLLAQSIADRALELVRARYDAPKIRSVIRRLTLSDLAS